MQICFIGVVYSSFGSVRCSLVIPAQVFQPPLQLYDEALQIHHIIIYHPSAY
jgi:hypothetical protein